MFVMFPTLYVLYLQRMECQDRKGHDIGGFVNSFGLLAGRMRRNTDMLEYRRRICAEAYSSRDGIRYDLSSFRRLGHIL